MRRGRTKSSLRGAVVCCVLAVVALSLGPSGEAVVRSALRDAARPGIAAGHWLDRRFASLDMNRWPWTVGSARTAAPDDKANAVQSNRTQEELRRLRIALAASRREIATLERSLGPVGLVESVAAVGVERVPARILSRSDGSLAPGGMLLGAGSHGGIEPGRVAVESMSLAAGEREEVSDGEIILAGASVLGRTDEVGMWTSTILPVTDPTFRAHVWIVRETNDGPVFGDEGILEGDGRGGCAVKYVPSTASVAAGDHVYSRDPTGRIPQPLYYGTIDRAELREGAPHWDIDVRPAVDAATIDEVHVLRPRSDESLPLPAN